MSNRIMVVHKDKCNPQGCGGYLCMRVSPSNRAGKEAIVKDEDDGKVKVNEDVISEADQIAANKCPFDALEMINLPEELDEDPVHRYLPNGFSLYSVPTPLEDNVVGLLGENGIGKTTALEIIAGELEPNFGDEGTGGYDALADRYKGTEAQAFFESLSDETITVSMKPQHVDQIPDVFSGPVNDLLRGVDERGVATEVIDDLDLSSVANRDVQDLSGGELQRVAIAATVVKDADLYLFDEPTSYLDIKQRLRVSKYIKSLAEDNAVLCIEHDLIVLDYLTDLVHVMYGEHGGYGVCSLGKTTKAGINMYLDGFIAEENMRFRKESISFDQRSQHRSRSPDVITEWPAFTHEYDEFTLTVDEGSIHEDDVVGVLGENGIGKSTMIDVLAGNLDNDVDLDDVTMSYKPQHLDADNTPVRAVLADAKQHKHNVFNPLNIEPLLDKSLDELSGGELQRVRVAECITADADLYLLDEPSAYLDVEQRLQACEAISSMMQRHEAAAIVIDHDLLFLDYIANRLLVFDGDPGRRGRAKGPMTMEDGMNMFLEDLGITFRRDMKNNRPRINKPGSQKDKEQKRNENYYYTG